MSNSLTLAEKLRSGVVRRWHIVPMAREQTIAEHMYRVQLIAEEILSQLGWLNWDSSITLNTMEWARIHDLPEVLIGDIPTPAKHLFGESVMVGVRVAEKGVDRTYKELEECVSPIGECPWAGYIVRLADIVEAANWASDWAIGQRGRAVAELLQREAINAVHCFRERLEQEQHEHYRTRDEKLRMGAMTIGMPHSLSDLLINASRGNA